jgi:hypothetical protein
MMSRVMVMVVWKCAQRNDSAFQRRIGSLYVEPCRTGKEKNGTGLRNISAVSARSTEYAPLSNCFSSQTHALMS